MEKNVLLIIMINLTILLYHNYNTINTYIINVEQTCKRAA